LLLCQEISEWVKREPFWVARSLESHWQGGAWEDDGSATSPIDSFASHSLVKIHHAPIWEHWQKNGGKSMMEQVVRSGKLFNSHSQNLSVLNLQQTA
jgi:hypothetical protein